MSEQYGGPPGPQGPGDWNDRPGPYQAPGGYGYGFGGPVPVGRRPAQVTATSWIMFFLGGVTTLLGVLIMTSSGPEIMELLTGSRDGAAVAAVLVLLCAAAYVVPAVYLRRRRSWARTAVIVVGGIGVAGGAMSLPGSVIGLALHVALIAMMLQQPTKSWFLAGR